ncbi:hypothetical protein H9L39_14608 [Fusarium oxysporum f. sp. albedinis]|nr:hypothetical protein H9L39_14608 [Fusarium oxysporum f. sp. albedinis]
MSQYAISWVPVSVIEDREMTYQGEPLSVRYERARFEAIHGIQGTKANAKSSKAHKVKACTNK